MKDIFKRKKVLITGGAGSVGRALTKKILSCGAKTVRVLDISENELFRMKNDFAKEKKVRYLIGDIRDMNRLNLAMEDIDIVIHLAAMKHVYACEYNPFEAIKTNIDGLQNVIDVARHHNVKRVIFSSTDKAAHPLNVMGMTKLLGEKLISLANCYRKSNKTVFASVRFGNVIGSNGSVTPLFKKQILEGKFITITDKDMTRFVITMEEAVELICSAVRLARGGETFVWKMRTLMIVDLAQAMIDKYSPGNKTKMLTIGKEKGEKLHEEIISEDELPRVLELGRLYVIFPLIDYFNIRQRYKNAKVIKNPVIASNMGIHMSQKEIKQLLGKSMDNLYA
jgi:FlaA1/EpsC-like NDP-sugar epimerase